jgi:hypothetical protein
MNLKFCLILACILGCALAPRAHATGARKWDSQYTVHKRRFVITTGLRSERLESVKLHTTHSIRMPPNIPVHGPVSRRRHG